jgi:hypothetical protein
MVCVTPAVLGSPPGAVVCGSASVWLWLTSLCERLESPAAAAAAAVSPLVIACCWSLGCDML